MMGLAERSVILVLCTEDRVWGALPPMPVSCPWWPEAWDVVAAAHQTYGLDIVLLRLLEASVPRMPGGVVTYLAETAADPDLVRDLPLRPWSDEPLHDRPHRQSWARPGGPAEHLTWAQDRLCSSGVQPTGVPQQMKTWNLSTLWRLPTDHGAIWLKVVPDFFAHEGAIIAAIARPSVPRLYAHEPGRLLMADLPGDNFDTRGTALAPMVERLTELQADWIDRADDLLQLGLPDRRLHLLPAQAEQLVTDRLPHFTHTDQRTLTGLVDDLDRRCRAVTDCGVPETLTHGDFHPGNVCGSSPRYVIIDWGDSCLSHPLSDALAFTRPLPPADQTQASTWFADAWKRTVPGCEPERAADLLRPMLPLIAAVTYSGFCQHIENTELIYHAADIDLMLNQAIDEAQTSLTPTP